jgi:hypothetical protein
MFNFDRLLRISNWLPKKFLYVCAINVLADVTITHSDVNACEITAIDVITNYRLDYNLEVTE